MNKFRELKNKGKQRNKDLPIPEPKALDEVAVTTLLDSLNEAPIVQKKEVVKKVEVEVVPEVIKLDEDKYLIAYGLCYNEADKKFMKFEIGFNPVTKKTKYLSEEHYADSAPTALNKLNRILSLKLLKREDKY